MTKKKVKLGCFPTPLYKLERLTRELGGPEIWVKRDDLSGLGFGGNKVRKLEFLMADALSRGCDTVLTVGGAQSNHACQTAAAARYLGLRPLLVLGRPSRPEEPPSGNLLLERIMGAEVRFVDARSPGELERAMGETSAELADAGGKPYTIPLGGSNGIGALGFVYAVEEIVSQAGDFDYIFAACGSGGTLAGLALGRRLFGGGFTAVGVNVAAIKTGLRERVAEIAGEAAALLGIEGADQDHFVVRDEYIGKGYAKPSGEGIEAIRLLSRTEGLFLDPVYTSKAMSCLIDQVREGAIPASARVLFIHTGGSAALFAYADCFI